MHELKLLVVDDQKSMRALAQLYLGMIGFKDIDEAGDASEAKEMIKAVTYDAARSNGTWKGFRRRPS